jgi:predicted TPR repeat methyltransferase
MVGDIESALARAAAELDALQLPRHRGSAAFDLGAGIGLHAVPLAQRGCSVAAIDSCQVLLDELRTRAGTLPIKAVNGEILAFRSYVEQPLDVILCMGDTLTHLPNLASVELLLAEVAASLAKNGVFATTFRDYASAPLQAEQRFIPVRSDERRILTCFLEYGEEQVTVYDVLHQRDGGEWRQRVSSYPKLRLAPQRVSAKLTALGLNVRSAAGSGGMLQIVAEKT